MKKFSIILSLLLLGLLLPSFSSFTVKAMNGWGAPTQLTNNTASDLYPSICGDGSKIAFASDVDGDSEIFVINSDGSSLTQLTHNDISDTDPAICADGSKIAYMSRVGGYIEDFEIVVVNLDGTGYTQLTSNNAHDDSPSICGDGSKIAFMSNVDGDNEIFVVNSDGSGLTQLTHNTAIDGNPSISFDGSKIAFDSYVDGDDEIFVVNSDGTGLTQLTQNTAADYNPSICGDGSKIAFLSTFMSGNFKVFVVNSDGSGLTQLTMNSEDDWYPSICGDGSKIVFYSYVDGDAEIFVVNSDGTGLTQLTSNNALDWFPSICGDGTKIAYTSTVDGGDYEIFVVSFQGGLLQVSPSSGPGGVDVELSGSGYPSSETVTLKYFDSIFGSWNFLGTADADASGNIMFTTEVPDLRRSLRAGDYAETYTHVSFRSEINGAVHSYADYNQYWRGMKTVGDQTAFGLFGNGTDLSSVVQVGEGDSLSLVGKWFHPGVVYVRWDGEAVVGTVTSDEWLDAQIIGTAVANEAEGYFETTAIIPAADPGEHYISIEDSETKLILIVYFGDSSNLEWSVDLFASSDEYYDLSTFGVAVDATEGFDAAYDSVDPPSPPFGLVSYFYYSDNPSQLQKLSTSILSYAPTMTWDYRVVSVGVSGSVSISWSSDEVADIPSEKGVHLVCPDSSIIDMRSTTSYSFTAEADVSYVFQVMVGGVNWNLDLDPGWNMVSFPALPDDPSFSSIFAGVPFYQVISWDGSGYVTPTVAEAGIGYWILVLEETTVTIENATPLASYTKSLPAGWSMIGSVYGDTVNADDVFPGFYQLLTWDGTSYVTSATIEPGKGYWALVLEPTTITVGEP